MGMVQFMNDSMTEYAWLVNPLNPALFQKIMTHTMNYFYIFRILIIFY